MDNKHFSGPIGIVWAQFGPYHYARATALQKLVGANSVFPMEVANQTSRYEWKRPASTMEVTTICPGGITENIAFWRVFRNARRKFSALNIQVCLLPSYWPKQSLAVLLAAKSLGIRTVLMNESHADTASTRAAAVWVKRRLVSLFDAALVGGLPQKRYAQSMGMPEEKIFTGYDAVDNEFFARKSAETKVRDLEFRSQYDLPEHYFLSLGRFIPKKNLTTLIRAYSKVMVSDPQCQTHLVMVGSGEEEPNLRSLCQQLGLPVYDKKLAGAGNRRSETGKQPPGVHFYGFRQIEENPTFYALADVFILPSLREEWGLVVNEAMSSGLPVVVSSTVGCAEDLVRPGWPVSPGLSVIHQSAQWPLMDRFIRQNGFVFDPRSDESVETLAKALVVLASNPLLRKTMARNSLLVANDFSCENFARNALLAVQTAQLDGVRHSAISPSALANSDSR